MTGSRQPEPVWVQDNQQLRAFAESWRKARFLALDTEFVRTTTFYPKAGLIQLADTRHCYLIDPLTITDWQPLADVFTDSSVIKVFHACAEDLEVCRRLVGVLPEPLADSQLAAAMAGFGGSLGFQKLVGEVLGVELAKGETRSNWLFRPLTDEQVHYAVADVYYLQKIYPVLEEKLIELGRLSWLEEDCQRIIHDASNTDPSDCYYRRIKMAWKLRPQEQYVLQQLAVWREEQARLRDVPRNKVVDDHCLWNIARYKPSRKDQLIKAGMKPESIRQDGAVVLSLTAEALLADKSLWPDALDKPLTPGVGQWLKDIRQRVAEKAEELHIPPEILTRKKPLEALVRTGMGTGHFTLPESMAGWRKQEIGEDLVILLQNLHSTR